MFQRNEPCTEPQTFARLFFHELDFPLLFHHFSRATGCQEAISSTLHVLSRESRDQYPSPYLPIPYFFVLSPLPLVVGHSHSKTRLRFTPDRGQTLLGFYRRAIRRNCYEMRTTKFNSPIRWRFMN